MLGKSYYQREIEGMRRKGLYYTPKYSSKRYIVTDDDFLNMVDRVQLRANKKMDKLDEHEMIDLLTSKKRRWDINRSTYEMMNLLFYHWYERRYNKNIINQDILINLFMGNILSWFEKFSKDELDQTIADKLIMHLRSSKFPDFTVFYEYYFDFFPEIEKFSFKEFKSKKFVNYLLQLFPKVLSIIYMNKLYLSRYTDEQIIEFDEGGWDNWQTHNSIIYSKFKLPSFEPSYVPDVKENDIQEIRDEVMNGTLHSCVFKPKSRDIENEIRSERNIPKIGEGWVSETMLYYKIKKEFANLEVIHHGSPRWLGAQHFDVYIPELNIAVEYQGTQHQRPVEYFGGVEAFEKGKERDARKKRLCDENDCKLFYVYPKDETNEFIKDLKSYIKKLK